MIIIVNDKRCVRYFAKFIEDLLFKNIVFERDTVQKKYNVAENV